MELLTAQELAAALRVTPDTIWRYTRTGRIPCLRLGPRDYRYQLVEVLAALASAETSAPGGVQSAPAELRPADPRRVRAFAGRLERVERDAR